MMQPQFEVLPPQRSDRPPPKKNSGGFFGLLVAAGALLFKFAAPLLILLKTGGSMLLSIGAYSLIFGWKFAAGIVVLIFVHEIGHVIAAKSYGLPVTAPMFIPFVGAYVMHARPSSSYAGAIIAYAGPLAGGLGGWACYYLGVAVGEHWIIAVAFYTFLLNLLNLLPIPPLDGSKIWVGFSRSWTPDIPPADRAYLGIFLAALISGLLLGCLHTWGNLPSPSALAR
jgi:Zn-dependent protease